MFNSIITNGGVTIFGKSKNEKNKEIAEIKTGSLNLYYIDQISEKRRESNKVSSPDDLTIAILTDAKEEEFRMIFDKFIAENQYYDLQKFPFYMSKNGFYCIGLNKQLIFPYQEW